MVDSWIFPAYSDPPTILTDKSSYYPEENINITAYWNIICEENAIFDIKILFLENHPDSYSSINTMISSSSTTIPIPTNNDSSLFTDEISYFTTILNSSELFNLSFESTKEIWVTLVFYLWIGGEINAASLRKTFHVINLQKYEPSFQTTLSNYSLEIGDQFLLNKTIVASENSAKKYPTKEVLCVISNVNIYTSNNLTLLVQDGHVTLNISKFEPFPVGTYDISFILDFTKFFCNSNLTLIMNIDAKYVEIYSSNSTNIPMSDDMDFFFDFRLLDQWGTSFMIENFTWQFKSNLNWSKYEILDDFYRIYFEFPEIDGEYSINLTLNKIDYNVQNYSNNLHFYKNEIDLILYLRNITLNQEISFLLEENLDHSLENIERKNLKLEFSDGNNWTSVDYVIDERYPTIMKIVASWSIFENIPQLMQNSYFYSRILFLGDELLISATSNELKINFPIIANFSTNSTSIIIGQKIQFLFENSSFSHPESYFWDFGDGIGNSTDINPVYQYLSTGNYSITLTTFDFEGKNNTLQMVDYILVIEDKMPFADFEISQKLSIQNESIDFMFTGFEGNGPCTYLWDFGDGIGNSTEMNPAYKYNLPGIYSISLTIIDKNQDSNLTIKNNLIEILIDEIPKASFWFENDIFIVNQEIAFFFNGTIGNGNETYLWLFGDGTNSTEENPIKTYNISGYFSISVEITDCDGDTDFILKNELLVIETDLFPLADFNSSIQLGLANEEIFLFFNGTEGNGINLFEWNIGNLIVHERNPIIVFNASGSYTISLSIIDSNGDADFIQKDDFIIILEDFVPIVDFYCLQNTSIAGEEIQFFYNGTMGNGNLTYSWEFGDNTSSSEKNPKKIYYTPGKFTIRLTVSDFDGDMGSFEIYEYVEVVEDLSPIADFYFEVPINVVGEEITFFYNGSVGNGNLTYLWVFGENQNSYEKNPVFILENLENSTILLVVTDIDGDKNFKLSSNYVEVIPDYFPIADFTCSQNSSIAGEEIQFYFAGIKGNGNLTYYWEFGDGNSSHLQDPLYSYNESGYFSVSLQIIDEDGDEQKLIKNNFIKIEPDLYPVVDFYCLQNTSIVGEEIQFYYKGTKGNGDLIYFWEFGDGNSSHLQDPIHKYNNGGYYSIFLRITDEDGDEQEIRKENFVSIALDLYPTADFVYSQNYSIVGEEIQFFFNGVLGNGELTYYWEFGDGIQNSTKSNPIVNYSNPGNYSISLYISDFDGDVDNVTKINYFIVYPDLFPIADFTVNVSSVISGKDIHFCFNGTAGNGNSTFVWIFGDGTFSNEMNPIKRYNTPGNYLVIIEIMDEDGDEDTFNIYIKVKRENWRTYFPFSIISGIGGISFILIRKYWKKKIKLVPLNSIKV